MCLACASLGSTSLHGVFAATLSAEVPSRNVLPTGVGRLDSLLWGTAWDGPALDFGFPRTAADYGAIYAGDRNIGLAGFEAFDAGLRDAVRLLLTGNATETAPGWRVLAIEDFTALDFVESDAPDATMRVAFTDLVRLRGIVGDFPGPGARPADVFLDPAEVGRNLVPGEFAFRVLAHEVGHALGLKHPFSVVNGFPRLAPAEEFHAYTVMSFSAFPGAAGDEFPEPGGQPQSFMMLDIQALQHLYGANWGFRAGDTTYRWDPASGEAFVDGVGQGVPATRGGAKLLATLWDGGGRDRYDLSEHAGGVSVDLAPGGWSTFSDALLVELDPGRFGTSPPVFAPGNIANALLPGGDRRALIEDATGGAGDDTLRGNGVGNRLEGGGGDDLLSGRGGADTLVGGAGGDTLSGGGGFDIAAFGGPRVALDLGRRALDRGEARGDVFIGIEGFALTAGDDLFAGTRDAELVLAGAGADTVLGAGGADTLDGGAGVDLLRYPDRVGGVAAPVVLDLQDPAQNAGGAAGQVVTGFEHFVLTSRGDRFAGAAVAERVAGGGGDDRLDGRRGPDTLDGGAGADTIDGGPGADRLIGGFGDDLFRFGGPTQGTDVIEDFVGVVDGGGDRIALVGAAFDAGLAAGAFPAARFIEDGAPRQPGLGVLLFDFFSGVLAWDRDGAGGAAPVALVRLEFFASLAAEDILVLA